ncbi:MAG: DUF3187 family protein, partial [Mariprofundaceae bacterium]|nr:DUF3187 family protein [Mariprofundaceae bacterium]
MRLRYLISLVLMMLPFGAQAVAVDLSQPLPVRNLYPPMMRFFDPTPDSALRAYNQAWSFEFNQHFSTVNSFDYYPGSTLIADMELYVLDPVVRRSVSSDLELTLRVPLLRPWQGVFDGTIQAFHRVFSMPNGGRQLRPNNSFAYSYNNGRGTSWQGGNRWEMGNLELSVRYGLNEGNDWALAGLAAVKLPTASLSRGWGSGAADMGLGLVASWSSGIWFGHLEGWAIQPFAKDVPGVSYVTYMRGSVEAGYRFEDMSMMVQAQGGGSPYRALGLSWLESPPILISFGLRGEVWEGYGWSLTVTENLTQ